MKKKKKMQIKKQIQMKKKRIARVRRFGTAIMITKLKMKVLQVK
jgi:hypothetical protein